MIFLKNYFVNTTKEVDLLSIVHDVRYAIRDSKIVNGVVNVIIPRSGAAVTIFEPLPDVIDELKVAFELFAEEAGKETLNKRKEPVNISSYVQAAMVGRTISVPVNAGKLVIDPYEEIFLIDFSKNAKRREYFVQVVGDGEPEPAAAGQQKAPPKKK